MGSRFVVRLAAGKTAARKRDRRDTGGRDRSQHGSAGRHGLNWGRVRS